MECRIKEGVPLLRLSFPAVLTQEHTTKEHHITLPVISDTTVKIVLKFIQVRNFTMMTHSL